MSFGAHLASDHFPITPSDTDQSQTFYGLFIGGAGTVLVRSVTGVVCTYNAAASQYLNIKGTAVMAASTATGIIGLSK